MSIKDFLQRNSNNPQNAKADVINDSNALWHLINEVYKNKNNPDVVSSLKARYNMPEAYPEAMLAVCKHEGSGVRNYINQYSGTHTPLGENMAQHKVEAFKNLIKRTITLARRSVEFENRANGQNMTTPEQVLDKIPEINISAVLEDLYKEQEYLEKQK